MQSVCDALIDDVPQHIDSLSKKTRRTGYEHGFNFCYSPPEHGLPRTKVKVHEWCEGNDCGVLMPNVRCKNYEYSGSIHTHPDYDISGLSQPDVFAGAQTKERYSCVLSDKDLQCIIGLDQADYLARNRVIDSFEKEWKDWYKQSGDFGEDDSHAWTVHNWLLTQRLVTNVPGLSFCRRRLD